MSVTLTLDDEVAVYLKHLVAGQERTPEEVATWIVSEDLRREMAIDAEIMARLT